MAKQHEQRAGQHGPVQEWTPNKGSVGRKRICFIGASYLFVHKVLRDMLIVGGFNDVELMVHDIDEKPLKIVADLLEKIARQKKTNVKVFRSMDRREALKGADAVVLSINTGGREADFRAAEVCNKYGIYVGVGDTLGPTALARNLRMLPIIVDIAKDMEAICPDAVLLNFTNPMSCVTGVVGRTTGITCWGLCHSADSMFEYLSQVFGVKKSEVRIEIGGVNHQAFVTRVWIKGEERTKDLLAASRASDAKFTDVLLKEKKEDVNLQQDVCEILGAWPSTGHDHLAEFYEYFYASRRIDQLHLRSDRHAIIPGRKPFGTKEPAAIIMEWTYGDNPVGDLELLTTEHSHELLWSYFTGEPFTRVLNLLNEKPFIRDIPTNACVEALVTVAGKKVTGDTIELPVAVRTCVQQWTAIHDLSIEAALKCDRDAARQALFLDPQVHDFYDIKPMLADMLKAMEPWLPRGWFE